MAAAVASGAAVVVVGALASVAAAIFADAVLAAEDGELKFHFDHFVVGLLLGYQKVCSGESLV